VDTLVQNIQSVRIFQYTIFSQQGYSSTKYSVSRDIPVQIFIQCGYFRTKYLASVGIPVLYAVSRDIPVHNA
jgi:hypothetical protein